MEDDYMNIIIKKDGDCWCAHDVSFVDLQVSPAGFGDTPERALSEYLMDKRSETCWRCGRCKQCDRDTFTCDFLLPGELVIVRPDRLCCVGWTERVY